MIKDLGSSYSSDLIVPSQAHGKNLNRIMYMTPVVPSVEWPVKRVLGLILRL